MVIAYRVCTYQFSEGGKEMPGRRQSPQVRFSQATLQRAVTLRAGLTKNSARPVGWTTTTAWAIELAYELARYLDDKPQDVDLYGRPPRFVVHDLLERKGLRSGQSELPMDTTGEAA